MRAQSDLPAVTDAEVLDAAGRRYRADGWTVPRQKTFLAAIAEGYTVDEACRMVGLSAASVYAFRRRAAGAQFAIGWAAANLLARERLTATLYARAIDGFSETVTRPDGSTWERHRFDNRLGLQMLRRLDGQAEAASGTEAAAARLIAQEFDAFLDTLADGPARAGLFLAARADPAGDLGPIAALARADRFARAGGGLSSEIDIADLDPAARAGWTADQWCRAEAAGLVGLAPPPAPALGAQFAQLDSELAEAGSPVWWDAELGAFLTDFPPPPDWCGEAEGEWGDPDYVRTLTLEEDAIARAWWQRERGTGPLGADTAAEAARDAWFAAAANLLGDDGAELEGEEEGGSHEGTKAQRNENPARSAISSKPGLRREDEGRPELSNPSLRAFVPSCEPTAMPPTNPNAHEPAPEHPGGEKKRASREDAKTRREEDARSAITPEAGLRRKAEDELNASTPPLRAFAPSREPTPMPPPDPNADEPARRLSICAPL